MSFAAEVETMMSKLRCATSCLLLLVCGSCNGVPAELCLNFESGSCGQQGVTPQYQVFVAGFPLDRVGPTPIVGTDGYSGTLTVGDTVRFRLRVVFSDHVSGAESSEVLARTWGVTDSSVVTVSRDTDGAGQVVAIAPGKLLPLVANDVPYFEVYACDAGNACKRVTEIVVRQ
jgi:hypothetical protein